MTIPSIIKKVSATKLAVAKTLVKSVRELEKDQQGNYIAFVDHDKDSFDVSITLDSKKSVSQSSCDCKEKDDAPCNHILAVLMAIDAEISGTTSTTKKVKIVKAKPLTPLQQMFEDNSKESILLWLMDEMTKDKKLLTNFKNHFEKKDFTIDETYINAACQEGLKAIINRRKTIQLPELTLILDIWKPLFDKVIDSIGPTVHEMHHIKCIQAIHANIGLLYRMLTKSTTKLFTFESKIAEKVSLKVIALHQDEIQTFLKNYQLLVKENTSENFIRFWHYVFNIVNEQNQEMGISILKEMSVYPNYYLDRIDRKTQTMFLKWLKETNLLQYALPNLSVITHENDFNKSLISTVFESGHEKRAVDYAITCIMSNTDYGYNYEYFALLEEFINLRKDHDLEVYIRTLLLDCRASYSDFTFLLASKTTKEEQSNFIKLYSEKSKKFNFINKKDTFSIKLKILLLNNDLNGALKKISDGSDLYLCSQVWDDFYEYDKQKFLIKLMNLVNGRHVSKYSWDSNFDRFKTWIKEKYTESEINSHLTPGMKNYFD